MARIEFIPRPGLQDYFESDAAARNFAATLLDL
jgi:hypothetical protein